ncbi:proline-rich protein 22 [Ctenodactylus gundi]
MPHPRPFYVPAVPQEGFSLQGSEGATGTGSQPVSASADLELAVAPASLYQAPNPENGAFPAPPAGLQMAPCGCFFDPRIYRIEWAPADFRHPLYKLAGPPTSSGTYLLEPQHYAKALVPLPYPHYSAPRGPQCLPPYFSPEVPDPEALSFMGDGGSPALVELSAPLPKEGLAPLPIFKDPTLTSGTYNHLEDPLKEIPTPETALQPTEHLTFPPQELQGSGGDEAGLGPPCTAGPCEPEAQEAATLGTGGVETPQATQPLMLPDTVLLEDAMKLFDCLPRVPEPLASVHKVPGPNPHSSRGGGDNSGDIDSLRLPEELLSFDYSVPEILDAVSSMDCFLSFKELDEEPLPCSGPPEANTRVPVLQDDLPTKRKSTSSSRKGRAGAKGRQAPMGARRDLVASSH